MSFWTHLVGRISLLPCLAAMLSDADFLAAVQHQHSTGLTLSKKTIIVDVVSDPN